MEMVADKSTLEAEARAWLIAHKDETGHSWPTLAQLTDVNDSTLSLFKGDKYGGNNAAIATKVLAYRERLKAQAEIAFDAPTAPDWVNTPTSEQITFLLKHAQSGRIVLIVTTPGIGKTKVAQRFAANDPNVWLATMSPSTAGVATMAIEIGEAIGLGEIKGSPQQLGRQIKARVRGKNGLLIIDEAQELTDKALNELRSWHDQTKVGIALMGNEAVVGQMEGRKSALAQISSRFSYRHIQLTPRPGDIDSLLDAWQISDADQRRFLMQIGAQPGALREITHTIEIASMMARGARQPLALSHLRSAAKSRSGRAGF